MDPILAQIQAFGFNWPSLGWMNCDGTILQITQNSALYSLIGTFYGGNGQTTFGIPDLRGRTIVGCGNGPGLTQRTCGNMGGTETVVLVSGEMPVHNHTATFTGTSVTVKASSELGSSGTPGGRTTTLGGSSTPLYNNATPDITLNIGGAVAGTVAISNTGQNAAHNNMQPFTVVNYCIATEGLYPTRQ